MVVVRITPIDVKENKTLHSRCQTQNQIILQEAWKARLQEKRADTKEIIVAIFSVFISVDGKGTRTARTVPFNSFRLGFPHIMHFCDLIIIGNWIHRNRPFFNNIVFYLFFTETRESAITRVIAQLGLIIS